MSANFQIKLVIEEIQILFFSYYHKIWRKFFHSKNKVNLWKK